MDNDSMTDKAHHSGIGFGYGILFGLAAGAALYYFTDSKKREKIKEQVSYHAKTFQENFEGSEFQKVLQEVNQQIEQTPTPIATNVQEAKSLLDSLSSAVKKLAKRDETDAVSNMKPKKKTFTKSGRRL